MVQFHFKVLIGHHKIFSENTVLVFLSSPEPKAQGGAYRMGLKPASVRPCIRAFTLSNTQT